MTATTLSVIQPRSSVGRFVAGVLVVWLCLAAWASVVELPARSAWMMPVLIAMPLSVFAVLWSTTPAFRRWALDLDRPFLILLHTLRMLGLGFVMLYVYGRLPAAFALVAGLGDAITAVWALFLGVALYQGMAVSLRAVHAWNTFGIVDFIAAVSLGLASRSAPAGLIAGGVTTDPMVQFPLSLVPLFAVPLFAMTHFIVYAQLRKQRDNDRYR